MHAANDVRSSSVRVPGRHSGGPETLEKLLGHLRPLVAVAWLSQCLAGVWVRLSAGSRSDVCQVLDMITKAISFVHRLGGTRYDCCTACTLEYAKYSTRLTALHVDSEDCPNRFCLFGRRGRSHTRYVRDLLGSYCSREPQEKMWRLQRMILQAQCSSG